MTETSYLLNTYSLPNSYAVTAIPSSVSPLPNGQISPPPVDEEEYTIKCICGYNDDDGNTVLCEGCDTWQHIECYYHGKKVPDVHFCTDCAPKDTFSDISADKARDRQRKARELLEGGGDRKVKRPASKAQKKKRDIVTTTNEQTNGYVDRERQDSLTNGKDQPPPAKKPKTSHRPSTSIVSLNGESRKRAHSNLQTYPSPSRSPQEFRAPPIPRYTAEFHQLYDRDEGSTSARDNVHTIPGFQVVNAWKNDPSLIASHAENAQIDKTPFVRTDIDWNNHKFPTLSVETKTGKDSENTWKTPMWKLVRVQSTGVRKNTIVGEIQGQVGTLDEYCQQRTSPNRWKELSHPDPFVFFHPYMDIYIDSRRSGTQLRYIRRSCEPNVTMISYVTADDEVHHCFVAKHDIEPGTELTASWYLSPQLFMNDTSHDDKQQLFQDQCEYISRVLANFGDCACNGGKCRLEALDHRLPAKATEPAKQSSGRKRKQKPKPNLSPLSNGLPTTSRAGSDTIKGQEDDDDHKSTSGSSGNGIRSRDLTPQGGALLDEPPMLGAGLTQREIRKIQAMEKAQKEQSQKSEKQKKKRFSGVPGLNAPSSASRPLITEIKRSSRSPPPAKTVKDMSGRSTPAKMLRQQSRPVYVEAAVQTDPEPFDNELPPLKRRKFCTPTQRLLKKLLQHRTECRNEAEGSQRDKHTQNAATSTSTSPSSSKSSDTSPVNDLSSNVVPLPSQVAHTHKVPGVFKTPALKMNLGNLPPVPTFSSASTNSVTTPNNVTSSSLAESPASLVPPAVQSLATSMITPTKKKLSLGDYMSRRKESSTLTSERSASSLLSPDVERDQMDTLAPHRSSDSSQTKPFVADATKSSQANENAIEDTPMTDAEVSQKVKDHESSETKAE